MRCNSRNGRTVFSFGISAANVMGRNSVGFLLEKIYNPMSHNFRSVNSNSVKNFQTCLEGRCKTPYQYQTLLCSILVILGGQIMKYCTFETSARKIGNRILEYIVVINAAFGFKILRKE